VDVEVLNSGTFAPNGAGGIGLANTRQRLSILYNRNAAFDIAQQNELVSARIQIPYSV
jgi:two-component system, LytTR family, sensor kinase